MAARFGPKRDRTRARRFISRSAPADIRAAGLSQGANCTPSGGSAAAKPQAWGSSPSHIRVVRTAATLRRDPLDVLPRILDVAGFAVDAILRIDLQPLSRSISRIDELVHRRRAI